MQLCVHCDGESQVHDERFQKNAIMAKNAAEGVVAAAHGEPVAAPDIVQLDIGGTSPMVGIRTRWGRAERLQSFTCRFFVVETSPLFPCTGMQRRQWLSVGSAHRVFFVSRPRMVPLKRDGLIATGNNVGDLLLSAMSTATFS